MPVTSRSAARSESANRRAYLGGQRPTYAQRTWQSVMDQFQTNGKDATRIRYVRAMKSKAFDALRGKK